MKPLNIIIFVFVLTLIISPALSLAQNPTPAPVKGVTVAPIPVKTAGCTSGLAKIACTAINLLNAIIPVLVSLGVVYFVWGIVQYMIGGSDEDRKKARGRIVYGIIALAVIVSLWGIVTLIISSFGLSGTNPAVTTAGTPANPCVYSGGLLVVPSGSSPLRHFAGYINCTIHDALIPFMFAVALAAFVWGVISSFIINSAEEAKRSQGKQFMIWGIVALTVMLSVWGLVRVLGNTFGISVTSGVLPSAKE